MELVEQRGGGEAGECAASAASGGRAWRETQECAGVGQCLAGGLGGRADGEVEADGLCDAVAAAAGSEGEVELVAEEPTDGVYRVVVGAFWSLAKKRERR